MPKLALLNSTSLHCLGVMTPVDQGTGRGPGDGCVWMEWEKVNGKPNLISRDVLHVVASQREHAAPLPPSECMCGRQYRQPPLLGKATQSRQVLERKKGIVLLLASKRLGIKAGRACSLSSVECARCLHAPGSSATMWESHQRTAGFFRGYCQMAVNWGWER